MFPLPISSERGERDEKKRDKNVRLKVKIKR
jgi:hypothetical protein